MIFVRSLRRRPALAAATAGVAIAVLALVVPVRFDRITAHDVALHLSGARLDPTRVADVARQMKGLLQADGVSVTAEDAGAGPGYLIQASAPAALGSCAAALARALVRDLEARGYAASATVTPRTQRVWGSVAAYALGRVISIRADGKSAAQLEAEIRQRLAEAGFAGARVSVTDAPGGHDIKLEVHDVHAAAGEAVAVPELQLTRNGQPIDGQGFTVRLMKQKAAGGITLRVEVRDGTRSAVAEVPSSDTIGDQALAAAIESRLRQAGLSVHVTVSNGEVKITRAP